MAAILAGEGIDDAGVGGLVLHVGEMADVPDGGDEAHLIAEVEHVVQRVREAAHRADRGVGPVLHVVVAEGLVRPHEAADVVGVREGEVEAAEVDDVAVEDEVAAIDPELAEAEAMRGGLHHGAACVLKVDGEGVEVGIVGAPEVGGREGRAQGHFLRRAGIEMDGLRREGENLGGLVQDPRGG